MKPYPKYRVFLYSAFVACQRVWLRCQSLLSFLFKHSPRLLNLVILRTLTQQYGMRTAFARGAFGTFAGSPQDMATFGEYISTGAFSPKTLRYILKTFAEHQNKGTFIDIGGHIGLMSIPVAESGEIQCTAFEPDKRNFFYFKRNIELHGVEDKVSIVNKALFDRKATLDFEISDWHHGDHRIHNTEEVSDEVFEYSPFREDIRTIVKVEADRLDNLIELNSPARPLVIKIDTQGSEAHIFSGGKRVLAEADLLVTEFCPYMIRRIGGNPEEIIEFLEANFSKGFVSGKHNSNIEIEMVEIGEVADFLRGFVEIAKLDFLDILLEK